MHQVHHKPETSTEPRGELASRMLAMPSHTNPMGNIFGGYLMSVMDAAALMTATSGVPARSRSSSSRPRRSGIPIVAK